MNDETKAAVEWLRGWYCTAPTDAQPGTIAYRVRLLLAHLDSEPARLAGVRYWTDLAQAEARDAAALRTRVAELEAQISKAEARVAELEREARELTQENVRLDEAADLGFISVWNPSFLTLDEVHHLARNWREGAKRVEKELAHWRSRAIDADARLREVQDELAHEKGGRLDEAAIRAACERETGVWPYGRIADAIVETLRTQQVHWEAFVTAESERAEKAEARVEELEQHKDDLKTMIQDLRGRAEKAEARVAELEAQAVKDDAHASVDDLNAARAVLAKYPEEE